MPRTHYQLVAKIEKPGGGVVLVDQVFSMDDAFSGNTDALRKYVDKTIIPAIQKKIDEQKAPLEAEHSMLKEGIETAKKSLEQKRLAFVSGVKCDRYNLLIQLLSKEIDRKKNQNQDVSELGSKLKRITLLRDEKFETYTQAKLYQLNMRQEAKSLGVNLGESDFDLQYQSHRGEWENPVVKSKIEAIVAALSNLAALSDEGASLAARDLLDKAIKEEEDSMKEVEKKIDTILAEERAIIQTVAGAYEGKTEPKLTVSLSLQESTDYKASWKDMSFLREDVNRAQEVFSEKGAKDAKDSLLPNEQDKALLCCGQLNSQFELVAVNSKMSSFTVRLNGETIIEPKKLGQSSGSPKREDTTELDNKYLKNMSGAWGKIDQNGEDYLNVRIHGLLVDQMHVLALGIAKGDSVGAKATDVLKGTLGLFDDQSLDEEYAKRWLLQELNLEEGADNFERRLKDKAQRCLSQDKGQKEVYWRTRVLLREAHGNAQNDDALVQKQEREKLEREEFDAIQRANPQELMQRILSFRQHPEPQEKALAEKKEVEKYYLRLALAVKAGGDWAEAAKNILVGPKEFSGDAKQTEIDRLWNDESARLHRNAVVAAKDVVSVSDRCWRRLRGDESDVAASESVVSPLSQRRYFNKKVFDAYDGQQRKLTEKEGQERRKIDGYRKAAEDETGNVKVQELTDLTEMLVLEENKKKEIAAAAAASVAVSASLSAGGEQKALSMKEVVSLNLQPQDNQPDPFATALRYLKRIVATVILVIAPAGFLLAKFAAGIVIALASHVGLGGFAAGSFFALLGFSGGLAIAAVVGAMVLNYVGKNIFDEACSQGGTLEKWLGWTRSDKWYAKPVILLARLVVGAIGLFPAFCEGSRRFYAGDTHWGWKVAATVLTGGSLLVGAGIAAAARAIRFDKDLTTGTRRSSTAAAMKGLAADFLPNQVGVYKNNAWMYHNSSEFQTLEDVKKNVENVTRNKQEYIVEFQTSSGNKKADGHAVHALIEQLKEAKELNANNLLCLYYLELVLNNCEKNSVSMITELTDSCGGFTRQAVQKIVTDFKTRLGGEVVRANAEQQLLGYNAQVKVRVGAESYMYTPISFGFLMDVNKMVAKSQAVDCIWRSWTEQDFNMKKAIAEFPSDKSQLKSDQLLVLFYLKMWLKTHPQNDMSKVESDLDGMTGSEVKEKIDELERPPVTAPFAPPVGGASPR